MLILIAIFLLILIPISMVSLHFVRPKYAIQGFLAIIGVLVGWILVLIARPDVPNTISILTWQPAIYFPNSPELLIDDISWYFAIALTSIAVSSIITSMTNQGLTPEPGTKQRENKVEVIEVQSPSETEASIDQQPSVQENRPVYGWQSWAWILILTSLGLVAVTSANMLTILLAWTALDIIELVILFGQAIQRKMSERIILIFSIRMAAVGLILLACILPWSQGLSLSYESIIQSSGFYLILASGLRLSTFLLQKPFIQQFFQRRELFTTLRLVSAAASFILLVRISNEGHIGTLAPVVLGCSALIGLYAGFRWYNASDMLNGQSYWLLGIAALVLASTTMFYSSVALTWSIACLLSGGLIFSLSLRHKNLIPLIFLGIFCFSTLPFSPVWIGAGIFQFSGSAVNLISPQLFYILAILLFLTYTLLLAGFIRFSVQNLYPMELISTTHGERWIWIIYPIGLIFIIFTHLLIGIMVFPSLTDIPFASWFVSIAAVIFSGIIWYLPTRYFHGFPLKYQNQKTITISKFYSSEWLHRTVDRSFRLVTRLISLISIILEGDGGILWAFVLFALIFVFLLR